jgi:hypothetical protein
LQLAIEAGLDVNEAQHVSEGLDMLIPMAIGFLLSEIPFFWFFWSNITYCDHLTGVTASIPAHNRYRHRERRA